MNLNFVQVVLPRAIGTQSLAMYRRCLFSTTASSVNANSGSEASRTEGEANSNSSGKEGNSGESHQSSNAGKSVRGGVSVQRFR